MQEVTLYTLKKQKVLVTSPNYYEYMTFDLESYDRIPVENGQHMIINKTFDVHRCPIRVFNKNGKVDYYTFDKDVEEQFDFEMVNYEEKKHLENCVENLSQANNSLLQYKEMMDNLTWKDHLRYAYRDLKRKLVKLFEKQENPYEH